MIYLSNKVIYLSFKYPPLLASGFFCYFGIDAIITQLHEPGVLYAAIVFIIISAFFLYLFIFFYQHLVEIELSDKCIYVKSRSITIGWLEITKINFTWLGLYKVKTQDFLFYFAPYDLGFHVFGYRLVTDEFDILIEKKKKELNI